MNVAEENFYETVVRSAWFFLRCASAGGASLVQSALSMAEERTVRVTTYTYKKVGKLEIRADSRGVDLYVESQ